MPDDIESGIDLEHLDQTARSRGYGFIRERMAQIVKDSRTQLEQPMDERKTADLRGFIRGVRRCAGLTAELRAEFAAKEKQG